MEKKQFENVCRHIARTLKKKGRETEAIPWARAGGMGKKK